MKYLMIENRGVAPVEAFTVLGATTTHTKNVPGLIGRFGSGGSMGTVTLLRHGVFPLVYCGKTGMEFFTTPLSVQDVGGTKVNHERCCVRFSGTSKKTVELGWTTVYGSNDWKDISLALREYVSNAIDAMLTQGVELRKVWEQLNVVVVGEDSVRAKDGFTRIFVPVMPGWQGEVVEEFLENIGQWFLHASEPESLGVAVLEKNGRNMVRKERNGINTKRAVFYRRGVYVREFENTDTESLFDYNIDDLPINESRTVDDWNVSAAAGEAIKKASPAILARLLKTLTGKKEVWEGSITNLGVRSIDDKATLKKNWESALSVFGENVVVVFSETAAGAVGRKGYVPVLLKFYYSELCRQLGIDTDETILTDDDRRGRTYSDANKPLTDTVDRYWDAILRAKMTNGREKPKCLLFHEHMNAGSEKFGFYRDNTVYVHQDYATGPNDALDLTVIEELSHHASGGSDNSRDFQQWLIRFLHVALKK